jgi:hypothetical protein
VFIRAKTVKDKTYFQAIQTYRDKQGRVRHRTVVSLGRHATPEAAIAAAQGDLRGLEARLCELGPLAERSKTSVKEAERLRAQVARLNRQIERLTACATEMSRCTPDPSQGSHETAGARAPAIRVWRGTPIGRQVLFTFNGRKIRELAAEIERGPDFKDAEARQRFATEMRRWASFWRHQVGPSARPRPKKAPPPASPTRRRRKAVMRCSGSPTRQSRGRGCRPSWQPSCTGCRARHAMRSHGICRRTWHRVARCDGQTCRMMCGPGFRAGRQSPTCTRIYVERSISSGSSRMPRRRPRHR